MVILDTNVISESMKPEVNAAVTDWLDRQEHGTLYLTSVNIAELFFGLELMRPGKRKNRLHSFISEWVEYHIEERILPFDNAAAREYVILAVRVRKRGYVVSFPDAQIASIAVAHDLAVCTRDEDAFAAMGVRVINPWKAEKLFR